MYNQILVGSSTKLCATISLAYLGGKTPSSIEAFGDGLFISLLVTYRLSSCIKDAILLSGRRYIGPSSASSCLLSCMVLSLAVRLQHKFVKINTLFQQQLWLFTKENAFYGTLFFNNSIRCSTFPGLKASCGDKKYLTGPLLCPFFLMISFRLLLYMYIF